MDVNKFLQRSYPATVLLECFVVGEFKDPFTLALNVDCKCKRQLPEVFEARKDRRQKKHATLNMSLMEIEWTPWCPQHLTVLYSRCLHTNISKNYVYDFVCYVSNLM